MSRDDAIVITGMGAITAAGIGTTALASALAGTQPCTGPLDDLEIADLPCRVGGRVPHFDPLEFMDKFESRRLDAAGRFLVAACEQALSGCGGLWRRWTQDRVGVFEASSLGGVQEALVAHERFLARGLHAVSPLTVSRAMSGAAGALLSIRHGIHGPALALSCGSVSSALALSVAISQIESGVIDAAIVAGAEAPLTRPVLALFARAGLLARGDLEAPAVCRPFDSRRNGTVLGEGAAAIVIERASSGARPLAAVGAVAVTSDAANLFAPEESATQQARATMLALERAGIAPGEIGFVSAHGTGTRHNDPIESRAIARALGEHAERVPVSSSKPLLGHSLGACTLVEIVKVVLCFQNDLVPATLNLELADPECPLDYVPARPRKLHVDTALVDNSSFGGRNSCVVLQRPRE